MTYVNSKQMITGMAKRTIIILSILVLAQGAGLRAQGLTQETFKIGKTLARGYLC